MTRRASENPPWTRDALADALAGQADHLDLAAAEACLDSLCALAGIAAGAAAAAVAGGREAVRAARLERAKHHIERHLAEPDLSPAAVARGRGLGAAAPAIVR